MALTLTSPDITGGPIDKKHAFNDWGCGGDNISPELNWSDVPEGTQSFVVMVHDPDAPTGGAGFWHWILLDVPGDATGLARGEVPAGARAVANDYGLESWGGPCPPEGHGPHRYNFTVYAMPEAKLEGLEGASKAVVGFTVNAKALGSATIQGTYER